LSEEMITEEKLLTIPLDHSYDNTHMKFTYPVGDICCICGRVRYNMKHISTNEFKKWCVTDDLNNYNFYFRNQQDKVCC
jgi:hypothetical protein